MSDVSEEMRQIADQLRSQLATILRDVDELGREIRIARHHSETVAGDFLFLDHAKKSISAALVTAFDEMGKIDTLIAPFLPAVVPPPPSPPGGDHDH